MTKISQYTTMTTLASGDLLDISEDLGGSYGSRSITYSDLLTNLNSGLTIPSLGTANQVPYINAGATDFAYSANMTYDGSTFTLVSPLLINTNNELRLGSNTANYNALKSPTGMGSNLTYTLPSAYPTTTGQVMAATTGGVMSWADNSEPVVKLVNNLADFNSAIVAFNAASEGGIVKLGATITLAADLTIDFGVGIEVWGGGFGFNLGSTTQYKIIVNGTRGTFRNVSFTGDRQLTGALDSLQCIEIDDGSMAIFKMIECTFSDIVGTTTGTYNSAATSPIYIKDCANWTIFEFLFFAVGSQASGTDKIQGPLAVYWDSASNSGTRLIFKDFYNPSPEVRTEATRFTRYRNSLKIRIDGSTSTTYQNQVVYDESLTIDSASAWPNMDLYPNMYGSSTVLTSNDPTAVATYGVPGDVVVDDSTIYMKNTDIGDDTNWSQLGLQSMVRVNLTSGDITALHTTPIELVPAPGAGKILIPHRIVCFWDYATAAYTAATGSTEIGYASVAQLIMFWNNNTMYNQTNDEYQIGSGASVLNGGLAIENKAIELTTNVAIADPGTAAGVLKIEIFYSIFTI